MGKRDVLNSPRLLELKRSRRRIFLRKIIFFVFSFFVIIFLLTYLSQLDSLNIAEVEVSGNKIIDTNTLRGIVDQQIAGKYFGLFPKTNMLIYPKNSIARELQNKFKRLKDVNLSLGNNKVLEVFLTERTAEYLWCGENLPDEQNQKISYQKCYFLDESGYLFDEAPYFSDEVYFKFYGLPEQLETITDSFLGQYFQQVNFKQFVLFKNALTDMKIRAVALYVKNNDEAEVLLSKEGSSLNEPKIIFRTDIDFQNTLENLDAALKTEPLKSKFYDDYSSFLYMDLRFGNKIYYKFQ